MLGFENHKLQQTALLFENTVQIDVSKCFLINKFKVKSN